MDAAEHVIDQSSSSSRDFAVMKRRFCDYLGTHAFRFRSGISDPDDPVGRALARSRSHGGFTFTKVLTTGIYGRMRRDGEHIASDDRDQICLVVTLRGFAEIAQMGRSQAISEGRYSLISAADPFQLENPDHVNNESICFAMPRNFIDHRIVRSENLCLRSYDRDGGVHPLVMDSMLAFESIAWSLSDREFEAVAGNLANLIVLAFGSACDRMADDHPVRIANLNRAKQIIRRRLADAELSLSDVAAECGLSLHYLHRLFRSDGQTMGEYLRIERLNRARELFDLLPAKNMSVTDVAMACGFSSLSHFSTSFKQAFGYSPRDSIRAARH